jgi:hypothetical protein
MLFIIIGFHTAEDLDIDCGPPDDFSFVGLEVSRSTSNALLQFCIPRGADNMRSLRSFSVIAAFITLICHANTAINSTINSQVRVAYAGETAVTVSWNTFSQIKRPTVRYGCSPYALINSASSTISVTYNTSLTFNNHVKIMGLKSDTLYYYLPELLLPDNSTTAPYSFRTSRQVGDGQPYSIAVAIDMGTMGPKGLTTSAGTGVSFNNILGLNDNNTIQSLAAVIDEYDFLWHRKIMNPFSIVHPFTDNSSR